MKSGYYLHRRIDHGAVITSRLWGFYLSAYTAHTAHTNVEQLLLDHGAYIMAGVAGRIDFDFVSTL